MLNSDIPVKTSRGAAELGKRDGGLPQLMRSLLMLVDGRLTVARYAELLPNYGDIAMMFDALEELGLVTARPRGMLNLMAPQTIPLNGSYPAASATPDRVAPAPAVQAPVDAPPVKRFADADISLIRSALLDLFSAKLGYHSLDLMLKLESADSAQSLLATRELARALFTSTGADWKPVERLYDRLDPSSNR